MGTPVPISKWKILFNFANSVYVSKKIREQLEHEAQVLNETSQILLNDTFIVAEQLVGLTTTVPPSSLDDPHTSSTKMPSIFNSSNNSISTMKHKPVLSSVLNSSMTEIEFDMDKIKISSTDSNQILIIVSIIAVVIIVVLFYLYGVGRAKAKARNNQTITFSPTIVNECPNKIIGREVSESADLENNRAKQCLGGPIHRPSYNT